MVDTEHDPDAGMVADDEQSRVVAAALAAIHERGETVRERELDTALSKLESGDELDAETRAVLESLSERLVASVLEPPTRSLVGASADGDSDVVRTAMALFESGRDSETDEEEPAASAGPVAARVQE